MAWQTGRKGPAAGENPAPDNGGTRDRRGGGLPEWESFPLGERQLLVHLIVQTARRQMPVRAEKRSSGERG